MKIKIKKGRLGEKKGERVIEERIWGGARLFCLWGGWEDKLSYPKLFYRTTISNSKLALALPKMNPKIDKLVRGTTMVATVTVSYFLLTDDYGPEPNVLDPVCIFANLYPSIRI